MWTCVYWEAIFWDASTTLFLGLSWRNNLVISCDCSAYLFLRPCWCLTISYLKACLIDVKIQCTWQGHLLLTTWRLNAAWCSSTGPRTMFGDAGKIGFKVIPEKLQMWTFFLLANMLDQLFLVIASLVIFLGTNKVKYSSICSSKSCF